jgi:hypothetical protein
METLSFYVLVVIVHKIQTGINAPFESYLHLYLLEESNYYKKTSRSYLLLLLVTQLLLCKHRCSTITHGSAYQSL